MLRRSLLFVIPLLVVLPAAASAVPPTVLDTSPAANELAVSVLATVSITFDTPLDPASLHDGSIVVFAERTGWHTGAVGYTPGATTVTLTPDAPFAVGERVQVTLTPEIQSDAYEPMLQPHTWDFRVEAEEASAFFEPAVFYAGGTETYSACTADLDGDGDEDLAYGNHADRTVQIRFNDGTGAFGDVAATLPTTGDIRHVIPADVDGDGDLDLVGASSLSTFLDLIINEGGGSFSEPDPIGEWGSSAGVAPADMNGDGLMDFVVCGAFPTEKVLVLLNDDNGGYVETWSAPYANGSNPQSIDVADFDGDGRLDFAVSFAGLVEIAVFTNNGDGTFTGPVNYDAGHTKYCLAAGDLDGDGFPDLVSASWDDTNVTIHLNDGTGLFGTMFQLPAGNGPFCVRLNDLDGDGDLDIYTANPASDCVSVLRNDGAANFDSHEDHPVGDTPRSVWAGDVDGDGALDLVTAHQYSDDVAVLLNERISPPAVVATTPAANEVDVYEPPAITATFDRDMDPATIHAGSVLVSGALSGSMSGIVNYDAGSFTADFTPDQPFPTGETVTVTLTHDICNTDGVPLAGGHSWTFTMNAGPGPAAYPLYESHWTGFAAMDARLADLNGDGELDLVTNSQNYDRITVLMNSGGVWSPPADFDTGDGPNGMALGDLDGDGLLDLAVACYNADSVCVHLGDGGGGLGPRASYAVGSTPRSVVIADLDGDGLPDLAAGNDGGTGVSVLLSLGGGLFAPAVHYPAGSRAAQVAAGDLDGDGVVDLVATDDYNDKAWVLLGAGEGFFLPAVGYDTADGPDGVIAADLDGDGVLDLVTANQAGSVSILSGLGDGTFAPAVHVATGGAVFMPRAADLDGDGDLDLAATKPGADAVTVLINDGGFAGHVSYPAGDGPMGLAAGDLDGDGDLDLAASTFSDGDVCILLNRTAEPHVTATAPANGAVGAANSPSVTATFDVPVDAGTLDAASFQVRGTATGPLAGSVGYSGGSQTATFSPSGSLAPGERVFAGLTRGVESLSGDPLAFGHAWSFRVAAGQGTAGFAAHTNIAYPNSTGLMDAVPGDVDGDGDLDVVAAMLNGSNLIAVLENDGGLFVEAGGVDPGHSVYDLALGDLDGDGDLDIAAAAMGDNLMIVHLGNGDGTFGAAAIYAMGQDPTAIVLGDFDGDGDLDAATVTESYGSVYVRLNDGTGVFPTSNQYAAGSQPQDLAVGDLDGDGILDLAVADSGWDRLQFMKGGGDGSFTRVQQLDIGAGTNPFAVDLGDLDGDGWLDAVVACQGTDCVAACRNTGGAFAAPAFHAVGDQPWAIAVADLDGDGNLDAATANAGDADVSVLLGDGAGGFAPRVDHASGSTHCWSIAAGDLDGDTDVDLVSANFSGDDVTLYFNGGSDPAVTATTPPRHALAAPVLGTAEAVFNLPMEGATLGAASFLAYSPIRGWLPGAVSYDDPSRTASLALTGPAARGEALTFMLTGAVESYNGSPLADGHAWTVFTEALGGMGTFHGHDAASTGYDPRSLVLADLDGDGLADLVTCITQSYDDVSVYLNDGAGNFGARTDYDVGDSPTQAAAGDFDEDGDIDLAVAKMGTNSGVVTLANDGAGGFAAPLTHSTTTATALAARDMDGDGHLDLVGLNTSDMLFVLLGDGAGSFAAGPTCAAGYTADYLAVGDFTGDGRPDVAVSRVNPDQVVLLVNQGGGALAAGAVVATGNGPRQLCAGDLDGDGHLDLAVPNATDDDVRILLGDGAGGFASAGDLSTQDDPHCVCATDLDGDGDLDLAVALSIYQGRVGVLLNNGDATFTPCARYSVGEDPQYVAAADLDGDGDMDLAALNTGSDNLHILANDDAVPAVTGVTPAPHAPAVPADTTLAVTFSEVMDTLTIDAASFRVRGEFTGWLAGAFDYAPAADGVEFAPAAPFLPGERITAILTPAMASAIGIGLDPPYSWRFRAAVSAGDGTWAAGDVLTTNDGPSSISAGDLEGDGDLDLVIAETAESTIGVFLNNGDGSYPAISFWGINGSPDAVRLGDLDDDGALDAVTTCASSNEVRVYTGNGEGGWSVLAAYPTGSGPVHLCLVDLDRDGSLDVVTADAGADSVSALLNDGAGGLLAPVSYAVADEPCWVAAGDLDSDGAPDIVVGHAGQGSLRFLYNDGAGALDTSDGAASGTPVHAVVTADLDDDGDLDLACSRPAATFGRVIVFRNPGDGDFSTYTEYSAGSELRELAAGDVDADGDLDLLACCPQDSCVYQLLNNGNATFAAADTIALDGAPLGLALADLTGNGALDLAVTDRAGNQVLLATNPAATPVDDPAPLPARVALAQNHPNPFNPSTLVEYALPEAGHVELAVFDARGRRVATLVDGWRPAGTLSERWEAGERVPSGVYLCRLVAGGRVETRKMLLLK